jgi:hypothetical protein
MKDESDKIQKQQIRSRRKRERDQCEDFTILINPVTSAVKEFFTIQIKTTFKTIPTRHAANKETNVQIA